MNRSSSGDLEYDPETEKSARARRKETEALKRASKAEVKLGQGLLETDIEKVRQAIRVEAIRRGKQVEVVDPETEPLPATKEVEDNLGKPERMANRTIRQLAAAPNEQTPLCINYPTRETPFELKSGLIHLLPTF